MAVGTVASQKEGPGFDSAQGPLCEESACSSRVCVGSLWVLWLPPIARMWWYVVVCGLAGIYSSPPSGLKMDDEWMEDG